MQPLNGADAGALAGPKVNYIASARLPTPWAVFRIHAFVDPTTNKEHIALTLGEFGDGAPVLARVHSECLTGDALFSQRCDCGAQLETALKRIAVEGRGILLYLRQEGRGIGLVNKIRAYELQDQGADTVEANERLGFAADLRHYDLCKPMLDYFNIAQLRLMTNNPRKVLALEQLGLRITERISLQVNRNPYNEKYLSTKAAKLGHWLKEHLTEKE
jgi:GTP cyclohydrolase II